MKVDVKDIIIDGKPIRPNLSPSNFTKKSRDERDAYFWGAIQTIMCSMTDRANNTERRNRWNTNFSLMAAAFATGIVSLTEYVAQRISLDELLLLSLSVLVPLSIILYINLKVYFGEKKRLKIERDTIVAGSSEQE